MLIKKVYVKNRFGDPNYFERALIFELISMSYTQVYYFRHMLTSASRLHRAGDPLFITSSYCHLSTG